jgi:hypothetical protein
VNRQHDLLTRVCSASQSGGKGVTPELFMVVALPEANPTPITRQRGQDPIDGSYPHAQMCRTGAPLCVGA